MSLREFLKHHYDNRNIYPRLKYLFDSIDDHNQLHSLTFIGNEKQQSKREFFCLTISELLKLYELFSGKSMHLYECVPETRIVKAFIDFEYITNRNLSINLSTSIFCCLSVLYCALNYEECSVHGLHEFRSKVLERFLILNRLESSNFNDFHPS